MLDNPNTEQKIDYIYKSLIAREEKEKRALIFKWAFRFIILVYIWYFFFFALPTMVESFTSSMIPDISGISLPEGSLDKISELLKR